MNLTINKYDSDIFDITFQNDHQALNEKERECEHIANKVYSFTKSWFRELIYCISTFIVTTQENIMGIPNEYVIPKAENNTWKNDSKGLFIAIHGVNGRPNIWRTQLTALQKNQSKFDIRLPYVPKKGNCSLDESVAPIEAMIRDYIRNNPLKPICLLGVSNGARIAAELEVRLRDTPSPIKLSTIAGAFAGTTKMDLMDRLGLAKWIYDPSFVDELLYQSKTATQLMKRMNDPLSKVVRSYDFYATPNDFQINPYTGAFPHLDHTEVNYFLIPGENHNSIVSRVSDLQIERCINWMKTD